ncbi:thiamine pyrophosphate-dependent dehydrogenase E1 component subunit alpha [Paraglaciecola polaris]|uniref:thiamine pyrophosphate-dependent dehydrogenase E1 component subunit alpha n=1 Tax=Paraglaciecola polaris TaxID=222814 RepID=UPI0030EC8BC4|tara:strand:+ start:1879 stop:2835 length:957 start_codon:yes stop_codon:yes gene_type:complete
MKQNLELYLSMLRIRRVEEAIAARYSQQKMRCPTHLSIGQEAVAVGVCSALDKSDKVYSSHRAHAHYLAKGGDLNMLLAELYGKKDGCTQGRGGSMHLCDLSAGFMASTAIVANSIPIAVGHALHFKSQGLPYIAVAFFGEGATEEGAFYEALNFAVVKSLPILFVCENNRYSVYSPLSVRQPQGRSIVNMVSAMGIEAHEVDGNNVAEVFEQVSTIKRQMVTQAKPVLIECHTYRHREHCGPSEDDDLGYRPQHEVDHWLGRDPLNIGIEMLGIDTNSTHFLAASAHMNTEIEDAFSFAESSDFPDPATNHEYLYAE